MKELTQDTKIMATGWYTTFEAPKHCNWYGCKQEKVVNTSFCEEHGKIKINVEVVKNRKIDNLEPVRFKGKVYKRK